MPKIRHIGSFFCGTDSLPVYADLMLNRDLKPYGDTVTEYKTQAQTMKIRRKIQ